MKVRKATASQRGEGGSQPENGKGGRRGKPEALESGWKGLLMGGIDDEMSRDLLLEVTENQDYWRQNRGGETRESFASVPHKN